MAENTETTPSKALHLFIDFNAGFIGGIMNVLSGHPLE